MNVHVYRFRRHSKHQEVIRLLIFRNKTAITHLHRLVKIWVTHISPVHKHILQRVSLPRILRTAHEARYLNQRRIHSQRKQLPVYRIAQQCHYSLLKCPRQQLIHQPLIMRQRKLHIMVHQCQFLKFLDDVAKLHLVALQKLTPCRNIKEDVFYLKITALRTRAWLLTVAHRRAYHQLCPQLIAFPLGPQFHLRYRGYRRQRLASEPHRSQREQVFSARYLRRAVPLKGQSGIGRTHALPVIHHLYQRTPCILQVYIHLCRSGIHRVLHQLFYHRGRTLYHLAGRYLVRH